jgi:hypothetical protein
VTCKCHSDDSLYGSLYDCPGCGHRSLDVLKTWAGCERRACGWQTESRRSYRKLASWPVYGLFDAADRLFATIRAESAQAARVLFIGAYGSGAAKGGRVRRI